MTTAATLCSLVVMKSFRDIIDAYTVKHLAAVLGLPESHVRTMRTRDSIPPEYWADVLAQPPKTMKRLRLETLIALRKARAA